MLCNCNKSLIKNCKKDRHAKLAFVQSVKIYMHRLLTSLFGKLRSIVQSEDFCSCEYAMK